MNIRMADDRDIPILCSLRKAMGGADENAEAYFKRCLAERKVFIAGNEEGAPIGYAQLNFNPVYAGFRRLHTPEIQDLNVIPDARRQGVGRALILHCEEAARASGATEAGISVGLDPGYGAAQRLYVQMGYIPDGAGAACDDVSVRKGDIRAIDDTLTLKMRKQLT
jgi:GNAT superfamily N-acetyltransferase